MYVIRTRPAIVTDAGVVPAYSVLTEMSAADLKAATAPAPPDWAKGFRFQKTTGERAHAWVRAGRQHETSLYLGEDRRGRPRVRYAKGGC